jgi:hypothetical protein
MMRWNPSNLARGHVEHRQHPDAMRKIGCAFDAETFHQVRDLAAKEGTSFAEQVRQLVEWGLEAANAN